MEVNYKAPPVAQQFHKDKSFVRGLMGPLGCLSGDTEFLTPNGWKRIDQYQGEQVAQWEPETGSIEFTSPIRYIAEACEYMWHIYNKYSVSMKVSDEHRIPYYDYKNNFQVEYALNVAYQPSRRKIPNTFNVKNEGLSISDEELRLRIAIYADGSFQNNGKCTGFCLRKERKKGRLRYLLNKLGIEFIETPAKSRPTETNFYFDSINENKHFTEKWYQCSQRQLYIILDEIKYWDGLYEGNDVRYFSNSKEDADFIQYTAHACNCRASICVKKYNKENWNPTYCVHIAQENRKSNTYIRNEVNFDRVRTDDGCKYCFEVPTSFFLARHNDVVFITGNSGKSVSCVMELLKIAMNQEPYEGIRHTRNAVVRATYPELKSTTIKTFQEWIPHSVCPIRYDTPISGRLSVPDIGDGTGVDAEFIFLALDQPRDIEKLKSLELTFAWVNEASGVRREFFDMLTLRVGRFPPKRWDGGATRSGVIIDSNMVDDMHWLYHFAEEDTPEGHAYYRQPPAVLYDPETKEYDINPKAENLENIGEEYYLRAIPGKRFDWVNVFLMANWGSVVEGKPVYPEWQDHLHVAGHDLQPMRGLPILVGFDFGLSPAAAFIQLSPEGQLLILDELASTESMGIRRFMSDVFVPHVTNYYNDFNLMLYGDPSGVRGSESNERTCFQEMEEAGFPAEPAPSNDIESRLNAVASFLNKMVSGKPGVLLDKRCKMIRKGFNGGYHFKRLQVSSSASGGMDRYKDEPEKNDFSHIHDALQYACLPLDKKLTAKPRKREYQRNRGTPASSVAGY